MKISIPSRKVRLSEIAGRALWEMIAHYAIPFGEEYLKYKLKWEEEYASRALEEYRKFAFLALLSEVEITPSEQIDEVWHLHILHTQDYQKFGGISGQFLHHWPGMPTERPRWNNQYLRTLALYREVFGEDAPADIWPVHKSKGSDAHLKVRDVLSLYRTRQRQFAVAV